MINWSNNYNVRYAETDKMGHVHHANYILWFEAARVDMMAAFGLPYQDLEAQGTLMPVVDLSVSYKKPAYFGDTITVHISIPEAPRSRLIINYEVKRDQDLLATGSTTLAFMTPQGKPTRPPACFLNALTNHQTA